MCRADIEATRRPFAAASPLAGPPYRDPAILAGELERIFFRRWLCVGHRDCLREAGDFLTRELGGESILLVHDAGGALRAFYNVCRHRGTRLVEADSGSGLECIRCPYHAWSYALDGRLIAAPLMDRVEAFDRSDYPLRPLACDLWEGFVFVSFDAGAPPLAEVLADFPDVSRYGISDMRVGATHEYEIAANWKLVCQNYGECYHCPTNHPQLEPVSSFRSGGNSFAGESFCGGPMRLNDGCATLTLDGQTRRATLAGLEPRDLRLVHYFNLYPAFLLSLHPDYVLTHTVWPLAVDRSLIRCEWLFDRTAAEADGFDPSDAVDFWNMTNEQDWALCERAQKGVRSRGYAPARYQSLEQTIYFFDNWYLETMAEVLAGDTGASDRSDRPAAAVDPTSRAAGVDDRGHPR